MKRQVKVNGTVLEYTLIQTARQNILIQALEGGLTKVYAPKHARLRDIDRTVIQNAQKIAEMAESLKPEPLKDGDRVRIEGRPRLVRILKGPAGAALEDDVFTITVPDPTDPDAPRAQAISYLSALALSRIRDRVNHYLPLTGGSVNRITVRNQHSRWGSCSSKQNLNFNWRLILAPPQCLDYVVIHELCHLTEFNHSRRFWALVEAQMKDYQVWKQYLKVNGAGLMI